MDNPTNNFHYAVFEGDYALEGQTHIGFGIIITSTTDNMIIAKIEDITTSKYELCTLAQLCNELSLDPIHIYDVVEDCIERINHDKCCRRQYDFTLKSKILDNAINRRNGDGVILLYQQSYKL